MGSTLGSALLTSTALTLVPKPTFDASVIAPTTAVDVAPSCTATFAAIERGIECYSIAGGAWKTTTTIPYYIPCLGCSALTTSIYLVSCDCCAPPKPTTTYPSTRTVFTPQCSPTPDPEEFDRPDLPTDLTTTVPYTDHIPGKPQATPTYIVVTSYAQGYCDATLILAPTANPLPPTPRYDSAWFASQSALSSSYCATASTVTTYTATAHVTSTVDCACCQPLTGLLLETRNQIYCDPKTTAAVAPSRQTVTATTAARSVTYVCSEDVFDC
jgi:hypothetical protein